MIDLGPSLVGPVDLPSGAGAWAASGAMALTGRRGGPPLLGPVAAAPTMTGLALQLRALTAALGTEVDVDGSALLGERAAITGHTRQGAVSCGGSCRLVRAADGWIAVSLARDDDVGLVPAWLEADVEGGDVCALDAAIAERTCAVLVERASWLGLACSGLGEETRADVPAHRVGTAAPTGGVAGLVVVDLSSLWAGPLCTQLLAEAGAEVIKVESTGRPDGARRGPAAFFDLMHAGKHSVALDFRTVEGRGQLARLLETADVVVEASRPRALEQLGIDAWSSTPRVWLSITGHGREQPMRVAFGDDAAAAGGLLAWDDRGPVFAADAAADPVAGLLSAVAVLDRLVAGDRWLVDVSLARAARLATGAGETEGAPNEWMGAVTPPRARPWHGPAPRFAADTDRILARLDG